MDIALFNFETHRVRIFLRNGEPWWVVHEVCKVLGIANPSSVVERLDEDDLDFMEVTDSLGRTQPMNMVNEYGLYDIIWRSNKPEAKIFKRWIKREVLPQIRKTGNYVGNPLALYILDEPMKWEKMFHEWVKAESKRLSIPYPTLIRRYLYEQFLPDGVIQAIDKKNPTNVMGDRRYKQHQFLTVIKGRPELRERLEAFKAIAQACTTKQELDMFVANYARNNVKAITA